MSQNMINTELGYFEQDVKYDKKFYTNNCLSVLKIIGALIIMYIFHFFIFWGHLALGTTNTEAYLWLNVGLFIFIAGWIGVMVTFGKKNNAKFAKYEFYQEKINEMEQKIKEEKVRREQKEAQESKIRSQASGLM